MLYFDGVAKEALQTEHLEGYISGLKILLAGSLVYYIVLSVSFGEVIC